MCGIAGLFLKQSNLQSQLGSLTGAMMIELTDRGPDSAGLAVYRDAGSEAHSKLTLSPDSVDFDWDELQESLSRQFGQSPACTQRDDHFVVELESDTQAAVDFLAEEFSDVSIVSAGKRIEIYKKAGLPTTVLDALDVSSLSGTHAVGHTRMATESAVTTAHSHPFSTGLDLCLVHNGSLSNHNRLRDRLQRNGIDTVTDNDSEVAAGYLTWRLANGDNVEQALMRAIDDLDGFYTFAVGTHDGFAVLRDPIACKPAVLAETDDWVAMSSEYRAIATLPGAEHATVWEPEPGQVYSWKLSDYATH